MSFNKYYPNRKDWRKPSRKAAGSCHPNGGCPYCESNRFHYLRKRELSAKEQVMEYNNQQWIKDEIIFDKLDEEYGWCETPDELYEKYNIKIVQF